VAEARGADAASTSEQDPIALAQSVFATRGCNDCHSVSNNGTPGFNQKGKQLGHDFEGCSQMLADMNLIALVDKDQRSPAAARIAARFDEFGCGFCHKITSGKLGLTELDRNSATCT
jgi:cytochrome c551/c552